MRITNKMMIDNVAVNLSKQTQQLFEKQKAIATGKRINRISDDPIAAGKVMDYRKTLTSIEQYTKNIALGKTRLEFSEIVLDEAYDLLNTAVNLAINESSGTLDTRSMSTEEIRSLHDQIVHLANSKLGDNYLFAGHQTDTVPFSNRIEISGAVPGDIVFGLAADATDAIIEIKDATDTLVRTINLGDGITPGSGGTAATNTVVWDGRDSGGTMLSDGVYTFTVAASNAGLEVVDYYTYNGDSGEFRIILGDNLDLRVEADGNSTFNDIFYRLSQLQQGLQNPNLSAGSAQISAVVDPLNTAHDQIKNIRAERSAKFKHLEVTEGQYAKLKMNLQSMLSVTEDVDITQAIVELQSLETVYETYLAAAARIIQPSLINFLS
jgi:flagellar hook-associated protein 3 FlgL